MPSAEAPMTGGTVSVPLACLSQPDDMEKMQTPGVGDTVTMQVEATVENVQGETAMVRPTAVNGKPLAEESEPTEEPAEADYRGAMDNEPIA